MTAGPRVHDSYKRLCTEFYDLDKPEAPPAALDFYWQRYIQSTGPVLEAMCGSGRFLMPFAVRGADIDGVDASADMLRACRRKIAAAGLGARVYEQFLQALELPRRYGFVFCPAGSFALVPRDEQQAALRALARHMLPDAHLALEMSFPGESRAESGEAPPERRVRRPDGAEIVLSLDESGLSRYDLVRDGTIIETQLEPFVLHPNPREEFVGMLERAGFDAVRALWPYTDDEARPNAPFAVFVAVRTERGAE